MSVQLNVHGSIESMSVERFDSPAHASHPFTVLTVRTTDSNDVVFFVDDAELATLEKLLARASDDVFALMTANSQYRRIAEEASHPSTLPADCAADACLCDGDPLGA